MKNDFKMLILFLKCLKIQSQKLLCWLSVTLILSYVVLCCVVLCCVVLCCVVLCYVILCYVMPLVDGARKILPLSDTLLLSRASGKFLK